MLAEIARDDDVIAGTCPLGPDLQARRDQADTGGIDEKLVRATLGHHLGVAGDDVHPGLRRCPAHGFGDHAEYVEFQTFFQDEPGGQTDWLRSAARQVVDRAVDRQVADVAAGKEQRLHHIGIRGQRDTSARDVEQGRVARRTPRTTERRQEEVLDQFFRQHPAATMAQDDAPGFAQRQWTHPVRGVDRHREFRHEPRLPAGGTGSRPRRRLRWTPWSPPAEYGACRQCRMPGTGWV